VLFAAAGICPSFAAPAAPSAEAAVSNEVPVSCDRQAASDAQARQGPGAAACESQAETDDRAYLLETASPGDTMMRQGPAMAIGRLNPDFVGRLAGAIREARDSGLPSAGIFSAYRPPGFGVGGFADKFRSLHSYGLAVDMSGIGDPGSKEARLWHDIAARHGVFCPYSVDSKTEWNHCQATPVKSVSADNPLRKTITAQGPVALAKMFEVGSSIIDNVRAAISAAVAAADRPDASETVKPRAVRTAQASASARVDRKREQEARNGRDGSRRLRTADTTHLAKSHAKRAIEPRVHEARKSARVSQGRRQREARLPALRNDRGHARIVARAAEPS
jgi:hypothetical protein